MVKSNSREPTQNNGTLHQHPWLVMSLNEQVAILEVQRSALTWRESDRNDGTFFGYFVTITHPQFILIKMALVYGILGPHSDRT